MNKKINILLIVAVVLGLGTYALLSGQAASLAGGTAIESQTTTAECACNPCKCNPCNCQCKSKTACAPCTCQDCTGCGGCGCGK